MTKELFIETIKILEQQYKKDKLFSENAGKLFPEAFTANLLPDNHLLGNQILKILQTETNDLKLCAFGQSWIEYFMYELNFGKKYKKGMIKDKNDKNINLSNSDKLYDFLLLNN